MVVEQAREAKAIAQELAQLQKQKQKVQPIIPGTSTRDVLTQCVRNR